MASMASDVMGLALRYLSRVFGFLMKWYYTSERLSDAVRVEVSSEGDGVVVNCGDPAEAHAWLQITNLSHFPVRVEGVEAVLSLAGNVGRFTRLTRVDVEPSSVERVLIEASLSDGQVRCIQTGRVYGAQRLSVHVLFGCRVRDFSASRDIDITNIRFLNCDAPMQVTSTMATA